MPAAAARLLRGFGIGLDAREATRRKTQKKRHLKIKRKEQQTELKAES